jgi:hypothetical protein
MGQRQNRQQEDKKHGGESRANTKTHATVRAQQLTAAWHGDPICVSGHRGNG